MQEGVPVIDSEPDSQQHVDPRDHIHEAACPVYETQEANVDKDDVDGTERGSVQALKKDGADAPYHQRGNQHVTYSLEVHDGESFPEQHRLGVGNRV
jgi:hypothetical protein